MSLTKIAVKDLDVSALKGVTLDSRGVKRGYLFAALPGRKLDGHKFISDAIMNGATYILAKTGTELPANAANVTVVMDDDPRRVFTEIVALFYKAQPKMIVAVTGTNGKTSTVHFINQLWKALDIKSAGLGTLGLSIQGGAYTGGSLTTPDPVTLHAEMSDLAAVGVQHLAMEASSHGLDQHRLDGVKVQVAAFTNFSRDHLDYHKDMKSYLAAKKRLFADVLVKGGTAVLNADLPEYKALKTVCKKAGHKVLSYGHAGEELRIVQVVSLPHGQGLEIEVFGQMYHIILPLVGDFQTMNALCSLACVIAENPKDTARTANLIKAMEKLKGVPGRLQLVSGPSEYAVYVDFAHKPDALESVLQSLKKHAKGRLICVFGCGGDRDQGKRAVMGEIAAKIADVVVVTDDNPRTEPAQDIRAQILKGAQPLAKEIHEIAERREAILSAVSLLQAGDVLVVAGKGHEKVQIFNGYSEPFDDVQEVEIAMRQVKGS
jgi:UDP-N-acetylmuramoyl-L-alanyl-D-glutamate--2,6-diaminopimelate ligase